MGFSFPHKKSQTKGAVGPDTDHISLNVTSVENDLKNKSPITLSWDNLSYVISGKSKGDSPKVLLDGVSGWVRPGEVVAIMGASGAGKSTLLNVLAGRVNGGVITGDIMVNGRPRPPSSWQSIIGYVEQEDLMYQNLTVFETLRYAALLRLPQTMSYEAKLHRVDEVVQSLSLEKCLHTRIGDSELRGISGGERKRVSIAIELVTLPRLLFLDEPTSGLDSFTASKIVECIRGLAERDQSTVLLTIHQPRELLLQYFSKIILLSQGKLVYFGSVQGALNYFEECGHACPPRTNPSDFFLDLMATDTLKEESPSDALERVQKLQRSCVPERPEDFKDAKFPPVETKSEWNNSVFSELAILVRRSFVQELRDKATIGATFGQSFVNIILLGFVFWRIPLDSKGAQNFIGVLFFICIQLTFGVVMPLIAVFTQQRQIIKRERASRTYRSSTAYLAKVISQIPLVVLSTAIFALPVYWMVGLYAQPREFFTFLAILFVHVTTATMLGIMVSSGVPNSRVGQIVGPMIIVVFLIFGGQIVNVNTTPVVFRWIRWISLIYLSYSALSQNQFNQITFDCGKAMACTPNGSNVLELFDLDDLWLWWCVLVNFSMAIVYFVIGYFLFDWRSRPLKKLK